MSLLPCGGLLPFISRRRSHSRHHSSRGSSELPLNERTRFRVRRTAGFLIFCVPGERLGVSPPSSRADVVRHCTETQAGETHSEGSRPAARRRVTFGHRLLRLETDNVTKFVGAFRIHWSRLQSPQHFVSFLNLASLEIGAIFPGVRR